MIDAILERISSQASTTLEHGFTGKFGLGVHSIWLDVYLLVAEHCLLVPHRLRDNPPAHERTQRKQKAVVKDY